MTEWVASGRARLACDLEPDDGRPAVLYLHPDVADRRVWRALAASVASTHRVLAFDRRGFGETTGPAEPYSDVGDALAVVEGGGAGRVVVVGNSGGGRLALDLALGQPGLVAGLALIAPAVRGAPAPDPDGIGPELRRLDEAIDVAEAAGDLRQVNLLEAHVWLDGAGEVEGRVGGVARALFLDMNGRALAAGDPGPRDEPAPAWERLDQVACPTLVAVGELDLPHVRERARIVAERIPAARLVDLPGVAHVPMLETRGELAAALRDLLAGLDY
ncbi:MAG TPA: alpha/beta hydrolase [Acidimicrobiales bacterium]|nr:alpha/beta hydrolase [Acidimicrobiales bacterium]